MIAKLLRKIVKIDEEKCNGCGLCVPSCAEGALRIIDGKARLVSEKYCDGLGACLGQCPEGAITVEEREADGFDEEAVKHNLKPAKEELPCGCPSAAVTRFERPVGVRAKAKTATATESALAHWPVQLALVPPSAPFLQGADLLLAADCVPFAYAGFHEEFLKGHALLVSCPKLDDFQARLSKLAEVLRRAEVKSVTVVHMEVPCCSGLVHMARQAILASGKDIPLREITVGIRGDIKE